MFVFTVWTIHTPHIIVPPSMLFVNGSPVVEENTVRVDIMATVPGASFMCELLRKNSPSMMADCEWWWCLICEMIVNDEFLFWIWHFMLLYVGSNGTTTFTGLAWGVYRLKIVASASGYNRSVIRRRVVIPRDSNYCTINLINDGVVVSGNNLTVHFRGVGPATGFRCFVNRRTRFSCEHLM